MEQIDGTPGSAMVFGCHLIFFLIFGVCAILVSRSRVPSYRYRVYGTAENPSENPGFRMGSIHLVLKSLGKTAGSPSATVPVIGLHFGCLGWFLKPHHWQSSN